MTTINIYNKRNIIFDIILCYILPNFIGCIYSLFLFRQKKSKGYAFLFLSLFVLFLTYNYYSVDNTLRYIRVLNGLAAEEWMSGNPLDYLLMFFQTFFHLQSSFVFFIYILLAYVLWFYTLRYTNEYTKIDGMFLILLVCSLALRNVIDLLYYTLAVLFTLYFASKKNHKFKIHDYLILIIFVYLLHPGLFFLLIPAIFLFLISHYKNKKIYYLSLIIIYFTGLFLTHAQGIHTGIKIIDIQLESFNSYTGAGKWGIRSKSLSGITYIIQFYILPSIYTIICIISTKYRNCLRMNLILALMQVCVLFYPSFISFVTISERILLTMSICIVLLMYKMVLFKIIQRKFVYCIVCITFLFTTIRCSEAISLKYIFRLGTYEDITLRSYYMPSIYLLDYLDWGFSDEFIRENSIIFDYFYNK